MCKGKIFNNKKIPTMSNSRLPIIPTLIAGAILIILTTFILRKEKSQKPPTLTATEQGNLSANAYTFKLLLEGHEVPYYDIVAMDLDGYNGPAHIVAILRELQMSNENWQQPIHWTSKLKVRLDQSNSKQTTKP